MKTYFVKAMQNHSRAALEALKQVVLEHEGLREFDAVFSLSYDRDDQFFIKTPEAIFWGRVFSGPAGYREISDLDREMQRLFSTFQLTVRPFIFFQELTSGRGLLKALPGGPHCFEFSFLKSEMGMALALKDLQDPSFKVLPPAPPEVSSIPQASPPSRLSRSEIAELMELSLQLRRLQGSSQISS